MSRKPSAETELRNVKRQLKQEQDVRVKLANDNSQLRSKLAILERDNIKWQARFDQLLKLQGEAP